MVIYKCDKCNKVFDKKSNYDTHMARIYDCSKYANVNIVKIQRGKFANKFKCPQCNKIYKSKDYVIEHINTSCKATVINIKNSVNDLKGSEINDLYDLHHLDEHKPNSLVGTDKTINFSTEITQKSELQPPKSELQPQITAKSLANQCKYCYKIFSRQDSLKRHLKDNCKEMEKSNQESLILKQILEEMRFHQKSMDEKMEAMKNENIELKNKIGELESNNTKIVNSNNNCNNNTTQNNQINNNNINIIAFGKEKLEEIVSDEICKKILFRGFEAVPKLVEYIHFNEKKPEYHNCYIPNMRGKYAIVFDGSNWKLENSIDVIEKLTENKKDFLESKFDDFYESLNEETKTKFGRFLLEADTDVVKNRYKESLRLLLYNKKGVVIETRNKFDSKNKIKLIK